MTNVFNLIFVSKQDNCFLSISRVQDYSLVEFMDNAQAFEGKFIDPHSLFLIFSKGLIFKFTT